ncbi:MAG TPA: protein-glutamate O-methyltransferase CheR [Opitutaceae bacterium]|jgi:chemotaxis protein methyltransferase CheR|nr:protein-glutamate O-methyltransferase CheR [Opitutaceae bacterium]
MSFAPDPVALAPILVPPNVAVLVRDVVHERTGVFFENDRTPSMLDKLEPLARAHQCRSFLEYYYILKYDEKGTEEWRRVMDAFSVQETYFWREADQIRALVDVIVPQWMKSKSKPLRIWSAACASGEEPYSIAMALEEAGFGNQPIEIVASDASEMALTRARAATYRERSFRAIAPQLRAKYFKTADAGSVLDERIKSKVSFEWANLVNLEGFAQVQNVDVIFCRNVFIYFSMASIKQVVASFARRLPPAGHLFVGSSESLLKVTNEFDLQNLGDAFVYIRNADR